MPSIDNRTLLAVVAAWLADNYPGCPLERVEIRAWYITQAVVLPASPTMPTAEAVEEVRRSGLGSGESESMPAEQPKPEQAKADPFTELQRIVSEICFMFDKSPRRVEIYCFDDEDKKPSFKFPISYRPPRQ